MRCVGDGVVDDCWFVLMCSMLRCNALFLRGVSTRQCKSQLIACTLQLIVNLASRGDRRLRNTKHRATRFPARMTMNMSHDATSRYCLYRLTVYDQSAPRVVFRSVRYCTLSNTMNGMSLRRGSRAPVFPALGLSCSNGVLRMLADKWWQALLEKSLHEHLMSTIMALC